MKSNARRNKSALEHPPCIPSSRLSAWITGLLVALAIASPAAIRAQDQSPDDLKETIRRLADQVRDLQARMKELEANQGRNVAGSTLPAGTLAAPTPVEQAAQETLPAQAQVRTGGEHAMESPGGPHLKIQGYTHTGFNATTEKGKTNGFFLGNFDLFITSRLTDKFSMLAELNFEAGDDNNMGVDLERMMLTYARNDHFKLSFGRYHTSIGYYNTAYHHGNWFETTTGRPFLLLFEDEGGILPVHNLGLSLAGSIPSGGLGLHYIAEMGNGRPARHPQNSTVQNSFDENNGKSFNFAGYVRPDWAEGMQAGFSIYHDRLIADFPPRIQETIPAAYVVYFTPKFEFLNEVVLIRHAFEGTNRILHMPGFYTQVGRQWGAWRPYFRYQYINTNPLDPVLGDAGHMHGPSFGVRYNWSDWVALKLQYDRNFRRTQGDFNNVGAFVTFAF